MRKLSLIPMSIRLSLVFFVSLLFCVSCSDEETVSAELDEETIAFAEDELQLTAEFEDVESITDEALSSQDESIQARKFEDEEESLGQCAVITHDQPNKTITVDFGAGCVGRDGRTRSGKIIVTYTAWKYRPGAVITTTLENYVVDSIAYEGTKTVTNLTDSTSEFISLNTRLEGGKATFPDGTVATRTFDYTRTWIRATRPSLDEFTLTGTASGSRRNGTTYEVSTVEELVFRRNCGLNRRHIPVSGSKEIQRNDNEPVLLDFGDGTCDRIATVSRGDNSRTIRL